MAMSKEQLKKWPWNNQPSKRHVWEHVRTDERGWQTERCRRCGSIFIARADTRGAVYCYPKTDWLQAHPEDDGATG